MSKQNKHETKQKNSVRIIAFILAAIMIISAGTIAISLLSGIINSNDTEQSDPHAGHNHD